jgi:hypothetical protein
MLAMKLIKFGVLIALIFDECLKAEGRLPKK